MSYSIQWYLTQWGIWQSIGSDVPRYVSPSYALMADNVQQSRNSLSPLITDDECLKIDKAIAKLAQKDAQKAVALFLYYARDMAYEWIAEQVGVSRRTVTELIKQAETWLDGYLEVA